eukprot:TRINITY_DN469_c0_g2_i2.p1 TRINITY_DN469_c0_g2~~TRINITY_DN469_c0_g2_i2.p1  ORF type:complete len:288 (-),score=67.07 TRINITY_DN469_c0_g2_i2:125-988(-)
MEAGFQYQAHTLFKAAAAAAPPPPPRPPPPLLPHAQQLSVPPPPAVATPLLPANAAAAFWAPPQHAPMPTLVRKQTARTGRRRGPYRCSKCGEPKKNHKCMVATAAKNASWCSDPQALRPAQFLPRVLQRAASSYSPQPSPSPSPTFQLLSPPATPLSRSASCYALSAMSPITPDDSCSLPELSSPNSNTTSLMSPIPTTPATASMTPSITSFSDDSMPNSQGSFIATAPTDTTDSTSNSALYGSSTPLDSCTESFCLVPPGDSFQLQGLFDDCSSLADPLGSLFTS